jgi:hypothetical protein
VSVRESAVPLVLVGALAVFVGVQAIDRIRSPRANGVEAPSVSPQGELDSASTGSSDTRLTEMTIETTRNEAPIVDTPAVRRLMREETAGTYMADMLGEQANALVRWPDRRTNMRVWIDRAVSLPDWNPEYAVVAERAFEEWQQAGFPLRFDMIVEQRDVDIEILWIDHFPPTSSQQIGNARKTRDRHGWLVSAQIQVATHDGAGRPLPPSTISGTVRHEIGHVLGLGHSPNPADVMYPESYTTVISEADRKTLRLLYMLPPGRMP